MRAKYNKSKIMQLAHHKMKYSGLNRSQALKLAWSEAKRDEFYLIIEVRKPVRRERFDMNTLSNSLTNFYSNNAYNGD